MALSVRLALGPGLVLPALGEALVVGVLVDEMVPVVPGGLDERLGDGRAVPGTFDLEEPIGLGLNAKLVDLVVVDGAVAEGEDRELELLGLGTGERPVGS